MKKRVYTNSRLSKLTNKNYHYDYSYKWYYGLNFKIILVIFLLITILIFIFFKECNTKDSTHNINKEKIIEKNYSNKSDVNLLKKKSVNQKVKKTKKIKNKKHTLDNTNNNSSSSKPIPVDNNPPETIIKIITN